MFKKSSNQEGKFTFYGWGYYFPRTLSQKLHSLPTIQYMWIHFWGIRFHYDNLHVKPQTRLVLCNWLSVSQAQFKLKTGLVWCYWLSVCHSLIISNGSILVNDKHNKVSKLNVINCSVISPFKNWFKCLHIILKQIQL